MGFLAHLYLTRGGAGGLVVVEIEACLLEIQPQSVQQSPRLAFRVCNQRLVFDFDHAIFHYLPPMFVQAVVSDIIFAVVLQAVGKPEQGYLYVVKQASSGLRLR